MVTICVAIPCHNNSWPLAGVLRTVAPQLSTGDQIIVVDDASEPIERRQIHKIVQSFGALYLELESPKTSWELLGRRSHARNLATKHAAQEIILYLDGDMLLGPNYLDEIRCYHTLDPWLLVRGQRFSIPLCDQRHGMEYCLRIALDCIGTNTEENSLSYFTPARASWTCSQSRGWLLPAWSSFLLLSTNGKVNRRQCLLAVSSALAVAASTRTVSGNRWQQCIPYSNRWDWCASNNLSIRRCHVERFGYWDENFFGWGEEDIDFAYRMYCAGLSPVLPIGTEARAYHLDHPVDTQINRTSLLTNANYLLQKFPELLPFREQAYRNHGLQVRCLNGLVEVLEVEPGYEA